MAKKIKGKIRLKTSVIFRVTIVIEFFPGLTYMYIFDCLHFQMFRKAKEVEAAKVEKELDSKTNDASDKQPSKPQRSEQSKKIK